MLQKSLCFVFHETICAKSRQVSADFTATYAKLIKAFAELFSKSDHFYSVTHEKNRWRMGTTRSSVHFRGLSPTKRLISQSFSAFSASSLKNVSAVSCSHSFSEAVLLFSLSFLRLICSEHYCHLLGICSEACCFSAFSTLLHNDIIYYKHKRGNLSSLFWIFLVFFFYLFMF